MGLWVVQLLVVAQAAAQTVGPPTMIKVYMAGLPRSGTTTTREALEHLGYTVTPGMPEMMSALDDEMIKVLDGTWTHAQFLTAMGERGYNVTGSPTGFKFWRAAAAAGAKIILSLRGPKSWAESISKTIGTHISFFQMRPFTFVPLLRRWGPWFKEVSELINGGPEKTLEVDTLMRQYKRYNDEVIASVPREQLLVFDVREGWAPLCRFLEVTDCPTEPVPDRKENKRASIEMMTPMLTAITWLWPVPPFILMLVIWACLRCCWRPRQKSD